MLPAGSTRAVLDALFQVSRSSEPTRAAAFAFLGVDSQAPGPVTPKIRPPVNGDAGLR
jgi:hypothetical protein